MESPWVVIATVVFIAFVVVMPILATRITRKKFDG